jgi:hypothetical protein
MPKKVAGTEIYLSPTARDDQYHCPLFQQSETMLQQMATLNTLLVGIGAELPELNRRVQKIEEELVDYKRNVSAGFSAADPSMDIN